MNIELVMVHARVFPKIHFYPATGTWAAIHESCVGQATTLNEALEQLAMAIEEQDLDV